MRLSSALYRWYGEIENYDQIHVLKRRMTKGRKTEHEMTECRTTLK
jgi:hypothetical protein